MTQERGPVRDRHTRLRAPTAQQRKGGPPVGAAEDGLRGRRTACVGGGRWGPCCLRGQAAPHPWRELPCSSPPHLGLGEGPGTKTSFQLNAALAMAAKGAKTAEAQAAGDHGGSQDTGAR